MIAFNSKGDKVEEFQEMLNWFALSQNFIMIINDGHWGNKTQVLYDRFLVHYNIESTAKLTEQAKEILFAPINDLKKLDDMSGTNLDEGSFALTLASLAKYVLAKKPIETIRLQDKITNNGGLYVRWLFDLTDASWDDGLEGDQWHHCAAFVIKLLKYAQKFTGIKSPISLKAANWRVPTMAREAKKKNIFKSSPVKPGDLILYKKGKSWRHTGIIVSVKENCKTVKTIESNVCGRHNCITVKTKQLNMSTGLYDYISIY